MMFDSGVGPTCPTFGPTWSNLSNFDLFGSYLDLYGTIGNLLDPIIQTEKYKTSTTEGRTGGADVYFQ